jgi:hypothetical protein
LDHFRDCFLLSPILEEMNPYDPLKSVFTFFGIVFAEIRRLFPQRNAEFSTALPSEIPALTLSNSLPKTMAFLKAAKGTLRLVLPLR